MFFAIIKEEPFNEYLISNIYHVPGTVYIILHAFFLIELKK